MLKKIILLLFIPFVTISCKKNADKDTAIINIEKFLSKGINYPNYYEFVDMTALVSTTEKEYYKFMKNSDEKTSRDIYEMILKDSEKEIIVTEVSMKIKNKLNASERPVTLKIVLSDSLTVENINKK